MSIFKPHEIPQLITGENSSIVGILLHGPNTAKIQTLAHDIIKRIAGRLDDPFNVVTLTEPQLKETPGMIRDELLALSFTGDRKAIWIREPGPNTNAQLKGLFENLSQGNILVIEGGNLKKTSPLRKIFETSKNTAAIACYEDTQAEVGQLVRSIVENANLTIDHEAIGALLQMTGNNRAIIKSETEKLISYCWGKPHISMADVSDICNDPLNDSLETLCDHIFEGNLPGALDQYAQLINAGVDVGYILNVVESYGHRIFLFRVNTEKAGSLDLVLKQARPPVFFKRVERVKRQVNLQTTPQLKKSLSLIFKAIEAIRKKPEISIILCERAIISLTRRTGMARSRLQ